MNMIILIHDIGIQILNVFSSSPGLVTLTWNNVNIDAFLHKMTVATNELAHTNTAVQQILATEVTRLVT